MINGTNVTYYYVSLMLYSYSFILLYENTQIPLVEIVIFVYQHYKPVSIVRAISS